MTDHASAVLPSRMPQVKGQLKLSKPKSPYIGSVRFFKHVIIGFILCMMILPWAFVVNFAGSSRVNGDEARLLRERLAVVSGELQSAEDRIVEFEASLDRAAHDREEADKLLLQADRQLDSARTLYDFESAYSYLHPELRVAGPAEYVDSAGTVYLTFDDGPGGSTRTILEILKRYDIKATFFVVGYTIPGREAVLRQIVEEGHHIGIHTYSHVYRDVYASIEAFLDDFARASDAIEEVTGIKPDIFRFPGGSINSYNESWGNTIISEMLSRGYRYYDWNVGSGDAALESDANTIYEAVIRQVHASSYSVVLMHDGGGNRSTTAEALPIIIDRLLREGYHFDKLTNQVRPTVFAATTYSRG